MIRLKTSCFLIFACLISLCSCDSCDDDTDLTTLPPETQTGANTFGYYVNGELFVSPKGAVYWQRPSVRATFHRQFKFITIGADKKGGEGINFDISNLSNKNIIIPNKISYFPINNTPCFCFGGKNIGEVTLTRFDTINKIVSGRFHFNGQCSDPLLNPTGDSIVKVTDGRFDIKLDIIE